VTHARRRALLFLPAAALLAAALAWGLTGLPAFGFAHSGYASWLLQHVPDQRHVSNIVAAIVFDYRGWDTAGEELIMFAAVMGSALLMRATRDEESERPHDVVHSDLLRAVGTVAVPVVLLLGLWTISYGYLTPGGGFQGGVVAAGAALLTWLTGSYRRHRAVTPATLVDAAEGSGAAGYLAIGLVGLAAASSYLANVLPLGTIGTLASGGTIAVLNAATGLEIAAACVLIFHEFLEEHVQTLPGPGAR
jgi:multicomponent Na+:H+ antiporter subunit B